MAGIYVHIPFCRDACHYCDFHFSISLIHLNPMLGALQKELKLRKAELKGVDADSVYIGGGTPSLLSRKQIKLLMQCLRENYSLHRDTEITIEVNPDDLNPEYLYELKTLGINRLSIGIQSFHDDELKWMNRMHRAHQALECVENAYAAGFQNINIDLIYGIPGYGPERWKKTLDIALELYPAHISAYHLTYEKGTVLDHQKNRRLFSVTEEEKSMDMFNVLIDKLEKGGYRHYEISNFARDSLYSKHNMGYWTGKKYLGFGPSAHSYDGLTRRWNFAMNTSYIKAMARGGNYYEQENLDKRTQYHDHILTRLRTNRGVDMGTIQKKWGNDFLKHFKNNAEKFIRNGKLVRKKDKILLTREGMFISDHIIFELFMPT